MLLTENCEHLRRNGGSAESKIAICINNRVVNFDERIDFEVTKLTLFINNTHNLPSP